MESIICPNCGYVITAYWCDDFEEDDDRHYDEDDIREQKENDQIEMAYSCTCGAWQISNKTGLAVHVADCICGNGD